LSEANRSVPAPDEEHGECRAVADILSRLGDKWTILVVAALSRGSMRYSEIRRQVDGISQRMLTLTLKGLEQDGLVKRTMFPTIPPRVDYELTELGRKLMVVLQGLYDFAVQHRPAMMAARARFAAQRADAAAPDEPPASVGR
jgi:DNA-binding HxlR family transcriptional regulator